MAMFVHITAAALAPRIRRSGISWVRKPCGPFPGGVFVAPVVPDFFLTHQWLRELRRGNKGPLVGVYVRVPDQERVWVGRYAQEHRWTSAAEAVALFTTDRDLLGWEVIVPRRIGADELHRIRRLPQVVGWRYMPGAHGRKPCGCDYCQRGQYGARRLREEYNRPWAGPSNES